MKFEIKIDRKTIKLNPHYKEHMWENLVELVPGKTYRTFRRFFC